MGMVAVEKRGAIQCLEDFFSACPVIGAKTVNNTQTDVKLSDYVSKGYTEFYLLACTGQAPSSMATFKLVYANGLYTAETVAASGENPPWVMEIKPPYGIVYIGYSDFSSYGPNTLLIFGVKNRPYSYAILEEVCQI